MNKIIFILMIFVAYSQDFDELYFGSDDAFDIVTWNIEWFPKNGTVTVDYVSEIIKALDADILAIQEVDNIQLFEDMVESLVEYDGYLESYWFAGLAYIYKKEVVEVNNIYEIYYTSPYWSPFPRSPLVMDINFMGQNYIIINNHYKCCGDDYLNLNDEGDEETRRYIANTLLKEYIDNNFSASNVILLGDLNDQLIDSENNNVFQMFINDYQNYLFVDMDIAQGSISDWSYPSWPSHLDHILITNELFDEFNYDNSNVETIRIDYFMDGGFNQYDQMISDHRPVGLKLYTSSILGDINNDGYINITDIVSVVDMILLNEYNFIADLNIDGYVNVVDVVQIVTMILN